MSDYFIELTRANTRKAVERAREMRPRVRPVSVSDRVYDVSGSKGATYTVRLAAGQGRLLGSCECLGAQGGKVCYHLAAAAGVVIGIKAAARKAVAR
jgi:hypothetical protein